MDEIVAFAELERFIDLPVRTYSSGMFMRLGFSVAAHIEADVLLLDEVFAVGDEEFQRKCFGKIAEFKAAAGRSSSSRTTRRRSSASAIARCCCARARSRSTARRARRSPPTAGCSQTDANPDELEAGLREWGSGEARIVRAQLLDDDGDERVQFAAGEPLRPCASSSPPTRRRAAARVDRAA